MSDDNMDMSKLTALGNTIGEDKAKQFRRGINQILGWESHDTAPMAIPLPITKPNLDHVADHPYFVCEKSDGMRYLALLMQSGCYLIQPNYQFRFVQLHCPLRQDRIQPGSKLVVHQWTLVDGLMVMDDETRTFLVYDALTINGHSILGCKLSDRLKVRSQYFKR